MKKKGFTLIELLVVIAIIAMLLAILMPALSKVKKIAQRVVCGTNLKGLGTAQVVYAHDYDGRFTVQGRGGAHTWSPTGATAAWQQQDKNWGTVGEISVGASLYLLVREADVSPKSFVCPSSNQVEFSGRNQNNLDLVQVWDFGHPGYSHLGQPAEGPDRAVSYAYHMPYAAGQAGATSTGSRGRFAADGQRSAAFAVMADRNPMMDNRLTNGGATANNYADFAALIGADQAPTTEWNNIDRWRIQVANSQPHDRDGQNILFADGSTRYENRVDAGVRNDSIYTRWVGTGASEQDRRRGLWPGTTRDTHFAPAGGDDSVLVNEFIQ